MMVTGFRHNNRLDFWNKVLDGGIFSLPNLLLVGDLNLTLSSYEVWGTHAHLDLLSSYFLRLFSCNNMVDLCQYVPSPTWRNGRFGIDGISKRLDRFLVLISSCPSSHLIDPGKLPLIYMITIPSAWNGVLDFPLIAILSSSIGLGSWKMTLLLW